MTRIVLAVRSTLFYIGYVLITIVMSTFFILVYGLLPPRGRYNFAATWCFCVLQWLRITCGVNYEVKGLENIPQGPAVYLSNHQSSWETLLFYRLVFPMSPILKKELLKIPFWGWALWLTRPIAIDRSKPREAGKSLLLQGVKRLKEGNSIVIFPEGTRSRPGEIRRFSRSGATLAEAAGVPVVPIAHNAGYAWPPRTFLKFPYKVTVEIGKPIVISDQSVNEITEQAESWIRNTVVVH